MTKINFHGHILNGNIALLYPVLMELRDLDPDLYYWCKYRLGITGEENIGSEESYILRTNLLNLLAKVYSHWEAIEKLLPVDSIKAAINEIETMIKISREYPVVVWDYTNAPENSKWVRDALSQLPVLPVMLFYFSMPHMTQRAIDTQSWAGKGGKEYKADKFHKNAFADFRKRQNAACKARKS